MSVYIFTDGVEAEVDVRIGITQDRKTQFLKGGIPLGVGFPAFLFKVLRPIDFDHQFCLRTTEINNIRTDHTLPMDGNRQCFQKTIPKTAFLRRHVAPQDAGIVR